MCSLRRPTACRRRSSPRSYFIVAEALTNAGRYADAQSVTVSVARNNRPVMVEVADDGVGGAALGRGSGLRGVQDRVEALDESATC
jgi:signal transduction histidine kinase